MSETDTVPVVVFKKRKRPRKGQKRSLEEIQNDSKVANKDDEADNSQEKDEGTAVIKKQKQFGKGLVQKMVCFWLIVNVLWKKILMIFLFFNRNCYIMLMKVKVIWFKI